MKLREYVTRRRLVVGLLSSGVIVVGLSLYLWLWYRPYPSTIVLAGTPTEMGTAYGKTCRTSIHLLVNRYLRQIRCHNDPSLIANRESAAARELASWEPPYREELKAIAAAVDLPVGAIAYGNSFLDMGNAMGCRSLLSVAGGKGLRHAHNLDWDTLGGLARWTVTIVRRHPSDSRYATVAIGFPGQIGALDIINSQGVALSFNQLGHGREMPKEPVFLTIRRLAETCASFDQAREGILSMPKGMPFIITLSSAASNEGAVFERVGEEIHERPLTGTWVAAANLAQSFRHVTSSVDKALENRPMQTVADLEQAMGCKGVLAGNNLYSVIFDFKANRFYLASGSIPAAADSYREYELFGE